VRADVIRRVSRDPVVFCWGVLIAGYAVLYLVLPFFAAGALAAFSETWAEPILLAALIPTLLRGLGSLPNPEERRFWRLLAVGFATWLVGTVLMSVLDVVSGLAELWADPLFLLSFVACFLAVEQRPHLEPGWSVRDVSYRFSVAGSVILVFALIGYLFIVPSLLRPGVEPGGYPTWYLIVTLDLLLALRFLHLAWIARGSLWKAHYLLMMLAAAAWVLTDTLEYRITFGQLELAYGTPWDGLWYLPFVLFVVARRRRQAEVELATGNEPTEEQLEGALDIPDLLLAYALLFPAFHISFNLLGLLQPDGHFVRELIVLASLIAFVGLAVARHGHLQRRNRELRATIATRVMDESLQQAQRLEAIGRLAGGVAHDFNNLLTVIQGHGTMLRERTDLAGEVRSDIGAMVTAARRGGELTRQLLAFGRRQVLQPRALDLNDVVRDAERMLTRLLGDDIELRTELAHDLWPIAADSGQLLQVLLNLCVNAREAMPDGGILTITTKNHTTAAAPVDGSPTERVTLIVSDTGRGMNDEVQAHAFEPFYSRTVGGTGLGLATAWGIVTQSGGLIHVSSAPGAGTSFTVELPRTSSEPVEATSDPDDRVTLEPGRRILLVEDEPVVRTVVRRQLELMGFVVTEASDGERAIELAAQSDGLDLLLTDVVMPGMNGWELAERLRATRPELRILYMSGHAEDSERMARALGKRGSFLAKPFRRTELERALAEVLEGSPRRSAHAGRTGPG